MADGRSHAPGFHHYLAVLRRRKWLVVQAIVIVPLVAVLISLRQEAQYQATADVLLNRQNLAATLTGTQAPGSSDPDRFAQTEAIVARSPVVMRRTLLSVGARRQTVQNLLSSSGVAPQSQTDVLRFSVTNHAPAVARRLVNEYVRQFTIFQREIDASALTRTHRELQQRLSTLAASGDSTSSLYRALVEKDQQLSTLEALQTDSAVPIRDALGAGKVSPRPFRNGLAGLFFGIFLGVGLAFFRNAIDTRARSAADIGEILRMPLLGRIPEPARRRRQSVVMLDDPRSASAEPYRILRTSLDLEQLERGARTIILTSAREGEGKSTTVANLAVAVARTGHPVTVVDLDLRHPDIARMFGIQREPGVVDVALGRVSLREALVPVSIAEPNQGDRSDASQNGTHGHSYLSVLPAGSLPGDPGEFMSSDALTSVLESLSREGSLVLIDTAPLVGVGDTMALIPKIDAAIVVARQNLVRRPMLEEVARLLASTPVVHLGYVVTGADDAGASMGYGYGGRYTETPRSAERSRV